MLSTGTYEVVDINQSLKNILPSNFLVDFTIHDTTLRTNLTMPTIRKGEQIPMKIILKKNIRIYKGTLKSGIIIIIFKLCF